MASNCTLDLISPWIVARAPLTHTRKSGSYMQAKYTPVAHTRFPSCSLSSLKYEVMGNPARPVLQSCGTAVTVDGTTTTGLACVWQWASFSLVAGKGSERQRPGSQQNTTNRSGSIPPLLSSW